MSELLIIALLFPLLGSITLLILAEKIGRKTAGIIATVAVCASFACFLTLYILNSFFTAKYYTWIAVEGLEIPFSLHLDPLSLWMSLIITGIGGLIHIYSNGYMDHDKDDGRFFCEMNFFIFAMLLLVLADNIVLLFVGWEGVGLASYLLIGYWNERQKAVDAAFKAFIVNRVGDAGLLAGIVLSLFFLGTANLSEMGSSSASAPVLLLITLLLFWGASGKSAQFPLHTWLPDAMEGPTPVSALIHAATMVTAGVYLVVRLHGLFVLSPDTLFWMGAVGGFTALYAALAAIGQTDLKRVLAFSTVSQLGFMFLACGVGAFYAAMFHLTTHAVVKALLFLSAGNVVHMLHGETEMGNMGGLHKQFPKTHWLFLLGVLALSGAAPFAAFFSKDLILEVEESSGHYFLFAAGLSTSILTAFYLMRAYTLTFWGKEKGVKALEPTLMMLGPVAFLGCLTLFVGLLGITTGKRPILEHFLEGIGISKSEMAFSHELLINPWTWIALAASIAAVLVSWRLFSDGKERSLPLLKQSFYVDKIYDSVFVLPLDLISRAAAFFLEPRFFERSLGLINETVFAIAGRLRLMQSGQIRSYAAWMALGACALFLYLRIIHD